MHSPMFSHYRLLAKRVFGATAMVLGTMVLVGCVQAPVAYTKESFSVDSPYQKKVGVGAATACEAARRALLGDGYVIDRANSDNVKGRKAYHSEGDRSTFIEMSVVCVPDPAGSSLYANGLLSTYDVKKSAASASVGVSALGSLSLPIGQSADSMVKISDETINDRGFYHRFFFAVDAVLVDIQPESPPTARPDAGRGTTPPELKVKTPDTEAGLPQVATPPAAPLPAKMPPVETTQSSTASKPLQTTPLSQPPAVPVMPPLAPAPSAAPTPASTQTAPVQPDYTTQSTQPAPQDPQQTTPQSPTP